MKTQIWYFNCNFINLSPFNPPTGKFRRGIYLTDNRKSGVIVFEQGVHSTVNRLLRLSRSQGIRLLRHLLRFLARNVRNMAKNSSQCFTEYYFTHIPSCCTSNIRVCGGNMTKSRKIRNRIIGIILIVINMYWFWHNLELAYLYRYSSVLFLIMLPDWLLTLNIIFSLIGIFFGIKITRKQLEIRKGILINLLIWFLGGILNFLFP